MPYDIEIQALHERNIKHFENVRHEYYLLLEKVEKYSGEVALKKALQRKKIELDNARQVLVNLKTLYNLVYDGLEQT